MRVSRHSEKAREIQTGRQTKRYEKFNDYIFRVFQQQIASLIAQQEAARAKIPFA